MSKNIRKQYNSAFKAKVALESVKGMKSLSELSSEYKVHSNQISKWKKLLVEKLPSLFSGNREKSKNEDLQDTKELYEQIGRLKVELDWLKKKSNLLV